MDTPDPWADDRYRVETPERVDLQYDVAGLGSRLIAAIVDTTILVVLIPLVLILGTAGLAFAFGLVARLTAMEADGMTVGTVALAAALLLSFALFWGYYVFFELVWQGQSPGKRLAGLRVIKEGGYPIGFVDSAIRNLVRVVDFLPSGYAVGSLAMLIDRRSRRLGDLAAGTLVVKERRDLRLESLMAAPGPGPNAPEDPSPEMEIPNLHRLTPTDQSVLREFWQRRSDLAAPAAAALAAHLATALAHKLEYDLAGEPPEEFLLRLSRELGRRP